MLCDDSHVPLSHSRKFKKSKIKEKENQNKILESKCIITLKILAIESNSGTVQAMLNDSYTK